MNGVLRGIALCLAGSALCQEAARPGAVLPHAEPLDHVRVCDPSGAADFVDPGSGACRAAAARHFVRRSDASGLDIGRSPGSRGFDRVIPGFEAGSESWLAQDFVSTRIPRRHELFAHTASFGDGFSPAMSFPVAAPHPESALGTIASRPDADPISINGIPAPSFRGGRGGEVPDIFGNIGRDRELGAVQLDAAAALQVRAGLFASQSLAAPSPAYPIPTSTSDGTAGFGGIEQKLDYLSPGDRLWLQAAYENGTFGTIAGDTVGPTDSAANRSGRAILAPFDNVYGWKGHASQPCGPTGFATCDDRSSRDTGATPRAFPPTFSAAGFGPAQDVYYSPSAIAGFGGAVAMPQFEKERSRPSFIGMPITGFDIGAEFMYINVKQARPASAPAKLEPASAASTAPSTSNPSENPGRLRVQRGY